MTPNRFASVIACALAAWQPSAAFAQEEDVQLWAYAIVQGDLDEETRLTIDGSARWREQRLGDEQQTLRFSIDRKAADGVRIGGGFGVFEAAGGATELRPHQEVTFTRGRIAARTRIEQRFFDGADRMELRFRQRLRYTQPLGRDWRGSIDGEYFNLVQTRNRDPDAARDQWRARLILTYRAAEALSLGAGYLFIFTPQPDGSEQINHVPQILVTQRF
ncbi:DUF2490 domain-containing protein [Qipengyuania sp. ASV99]|uniref:DUF2490 domain-containing protein n=1 Tax=Qipengyuania sp. ASV99 TaxID=3399681 RepID=UPI003A4C79B8